jgi:hypothetical protein
MHNYLLKLWILQTIGGIPWKGCRPVTRPCSQWITHRTRYSSGIRYRAVIVIGWKTLLSLSVECFLMTQRSVRPDVTVLQSQSRVTELSQAAVLLSSVRECRFRVSNARKYVSVMTWLTKRDNGKCCGARSMFHHFSFTTWSLPVG